jgi:hypothetical protein
VVAKVKTEQTIGAKVFNGTKKAVGEFWMLRVDRFTMARGLGRICQLASMVDRASNN